MTELLKDERFITALSFFTKRVDEIINTLVTTDGKIHITDAHAILMGIGMHAINTASNIGLEPDEFKNIFEKLSIDYKNKHDEGGGDEKYNSIC